MLQKSERPEVTDPKRFALDFKEYEAEAASVLKSSQNEPKRRSFKDWILDSMAALIEPIVERAVKRITHKRAAAFEKLRQDLDKAYAEAPNILKEYEESHKIKTLGKTINDIALWRAGKEQAKKGKNPKAKPVTRRAGLELDRYKSIK